MHRRPLLYSALFLAACSGPDTRPYQPAATRYPERVPVVREATPIEAALAGLHATKVEDFLAVEDLRGLSRIPSMNTFHDFPDDRRGSRELRIDPSKAENTLVFEGKRYRLDRFELMRTIEDEEAVYLLAEVKPREWITGATARKRELSGFEAEALPLIRGGESLVVRSRGAGIEAVGAIAARRSCLSCHSTASEGSLLGAFTYRFERRDAAAPVR